MKHDRTAILSILKSGYNLIPCQGHDRNVSRQSENELKQKMEISANFVADSVVAKLTGVLIEDRVDAFNVFLCITKTCNLLTMKEFDLFLYFMQLN